ncbi:hypothetical protein HS088_TW16G00123 [Tripterygium wilfordii]|uniref:Uncharacterized protein n=1 Tax=Tripterygium wilfordii TaxID=458696 RepID=A0A7J7CHY7_TRIWF|nr:hypothetical protein HS088_TW16G00123 [Tripterygium wilfordii]
MGVGPPRSVRPAVFGSCKNQLRESRNPAPPAVRMGRRRRHPDQWDTYWGHYGSSSDSATRDHLRGLKIPLKQGEAISGSTSKVLEKARLTASNSVDQKRGPRGDNGPASE